MAFTNEKSVAKYEKENKHCPECEIRLPYESRANKFCSHQCSATFSNRKNYPVEHRAKCRYCSGRLPIPFRSVFCSDECSLSHRREYLASVDTNTVSDPVTLKKIILARRGYKCEMCGLNEWNGIPAPLEVDHINGVSDDNRSENLRILCCNCHAQTPTYKSKNRGNGRLSLQKKKRLLAISADSSSDQEARFSTE